MTNKKLIVVSEKFKDFHKITYEGGMFEYVKPSKLAELQKDKSVTIVKFVEEVEKKQESKADSNKKQESKQESKADQLNKLKEADLVELAQRLGFKSANNTMTKKQLIEYIVKNDK